MKCRICGSQGPHAPFTLKETMYGSGETFDYFQCADCGCLQIATIPEDLGRFYPEDYYSFAPESKLKTHLKRLRDRYWFNPAFCPAGWLVAKGFGPPGYREWFARVTVDSEILDVGCGQGKYVSALRDVGFRRLLGADPFIAETIDYGNGVQVLKSTLEKVPGQFDLIMLHHSFEHMPDPHTVMAALREKIKPTGRVLLRVPVLAWAWAEYGLDWVQLDAPRHLFLHQESSIRALAARHGFEVEKIVYDSEDFQYWGSEQIRQGIPLMAANSHHVDPRQSIFSPSQIQAFQAKAEVLNAENNGDQAGFYLTPVDHP